MLNVVVVVVVGVASEAYKQPIKQQLHRGREVVVAVEDHQQ